VLAFKSPRGGRVRGGPVWKGSRKQGHGGDKKKNTGTLKHQKSSGKCLGCADTRFGSGHGGGCLSEEIDPRG